MVVIIVWYLMVWNTLIWYTFDINIRILHSCSKAQNKEDSRNHDLWDPYDKCSYAWGQSFQGALKLEGPGLLSAKLHKSSAELCGAKLSS